MNKKGQFLAIDKLTLTLIILAVLGILIFVGWAIMVAMPIFTYFTSDTFGEIITFISETDNTDMIDASNSSFVKLKDGARAFEYITFMLVFSFIIAFIILCASVRTYPWLIWVWAIGVLIITGMSIYLSWAYQRFIEQGGLVSVALQSWATNHYILSYMPIIFGALGILGGIIMFALITRDTEAEVGEL